MDVFFDKLWIVSIHDLYSIMCKQSDLFVSWNEFVHDSLLNIFNSTLKLHNNRNIEQHRKYTQYQFERWHDYVRTCDKIYFQLACQSIRHLTWLVIIFEIDLIDSRMHDISFVWRNIFINPCMSFFSIIIQAKQKQQVYDVCVWYKYEPN
jgi:hypothetical protein